MKKKCLSVRIKRKAKDFEIKQIIWVTYPMIPYTTFVKEKPVTHVFNCSEKIYCCGYYGTCEKQYGTAVNTWILELDSRSKILGSDPSSTTY